MQEVNSHAPETLFEPAPWMPEALAARIQNSIDIARERLERNFEGEGSPPKTRIVKAVAQRLSAGRNGDRVAASFLACVKPDVYKNGVMLSFALGMLRLHGTQAAQVHFVSRILSGFTSSADFAEELLLFTLNFGILSKIPHSEIIEEAMQNRIGPNILSYLRNYEPDDEVNVRNQSFLKLIERIGSKHGSPTSEIVKSLNWGIYCGEILFSGQLGYKFNLVEDSDEPIRHLAGKSSRKDSSLFDFMVRESDLISFPTSIVGRGAIILQTHFGYRGLVSKYLQSLDLPLTLVGRGQRRALRPEDFHISTRDSSQIAMNMLKLTKLHRKSPRVTRIFPDGPDSSERKNVTIAGIEVGVSMGAATLGWFARAPMFFADTIWTGDGFIVEFTPGPNLSSCANIDEAHQEFLKFYAKCVTAQINLDPRNFGRGNGIIQQLIKGNEQ